MIQGNCKGQTDDSSTYLSSSTSKACQSFKFEKRVIYLLSKFKKEK